MHCKQTSLKLTVTNVTRVSRGALLTAVMTSLTRFVFVYRCPMYALRAQYPRRSALTAHVFGSYY